jgi:hypothetical protein
VYQWHEENWQEVGDVFTGNLDWAFAKNGQRLVLRDANATWDTWDLVEALQ